MTACFEEAYLQHSRHREQGGSMPSGSTLLGSNSTARPACGLVEKLVPP